MTDEPTKAPPPGGDGLPISRVDAFSDGVFAIAITLLVLEIAIPLGAEKDLLGALVAAWPEYLAYVISYLTIGWVWVGHTALTHHLRRADGLFVRLNLLLLMAVAFLPFPTRLMAEYLGQREPERISVVIYGLVLFVITLLLAALRRYAVRSRELLKADLSDDELAGLSAKTSSSLALFAVGIALAVFLPTAAVLLYLGVSVYLVIPFGHLARAAAEPWQGRLGRS